MYTVVVEYLLEDKEVQQTFTDIHADSDHEAADTAYFRVTQQHPEARRIDVVAISENHFV